MKLKYIDNIVSLEYDLEKCTGCKMCTEVCPRDVFVIEDRKARVIDRDACIECGACMLNCVFGALKVETGPGCAAAILGSGKNGGSCSCG
jgi:NAD-dependent dihydropyrimidine dehydrogenase PreA subunit